ncbi:hypothetical protein SMGD1_1208 [Sulfurimonas gotlandica GD1]|jgi:hypothetical protein|uniref:Lipoprotein n=1 Tax=Sulfurimonas gotlandica (strain DSM 19862 / JCM 16533 / GD1) TaxID=929558 RepID=B6BGU8_SULGG|nr:hypothetical protein [Sulfurimonas gotlandica]EDZ63779.1 conserved hypothetical protein [Sulfurimonas gotlandica GD1]EHP29732.1 hypothetical protein SMGD1_1208 [Sulfurimonas gotlandica GD1]
MTKTIAALLSATVLIFSGCGSSTGPEVAKTGYEGKKINTYLQGLHVDVDTAKSKLEAAGFEIVATYTPVKGGTTVIFTNSELKAEAAKPKRAQAAILRLFIDDKEKTISFNNPVYFGKAYMQGEYNHAVFNAQLEKINAAFPDLKPSVDVWDFDALATYHFMVSMPYFEDTDLLGEGTNEELLAKANAYKKGKLKIFQMKLSDNSYLLGYELGSRTSKFTSKIGRANAGLLPWTIVIEDGKATALSAKYHIAISYPLLDMSGFMGIMTVPGAVVNDLQKTFK